MCCVRDSHLPGIIQILTCFKKLLKLTTALALVYTLPYNLQCICHAERLISDRSSVSGWEKKNVIRFYGIKHDSTRHIQLKWSKTCSVWEWQCLQLPGFIDPNEISAPSPTCLQQYGLCNSQGLGICFPLSHSPSFLVWSIKCLVELHTNWKLIKLLFIKLM